MPTVGEQAFEAYVYYMKKNRKKREADRVAALALLSPFDRNAKLVAEKNSLLLAYAKSGDH